LARSGSLSGETLFVRVDPSNPRAVVEPRLYRRIERRRGKNEKKDKPPKNKGRERYRSSCFLLSPAPSPDEDEAAGKKGSPPPYRRWHRRNLPSLSPPRPRTPMQTWIPKSKSWAKGARTSSRADCEDLVARMDALWGGGRVEEPEATKRKPRLPSPPPRLPLSSIENLASGPASPDPFTVFSALPKGASRALLSSETPSPVPKGGAARREFLDSLATVDLTLAPEISGEACRRRQRRRDQKRELLRRLDSLEGRILEEAGEALLPRRLQDKLEVLASAPGR